jgi:hypothetical protein
MMPMRTERSRESALPDREIGVAREGEELADVAVETLFVQHQRDLVDVAGVGRVHDRLDGHIAQVGDLALEIGRDRARATAHDRVGLNAPTTQLGDGVLGGLRLLLARRPDERHERDVDVADVVATDIEAELTDRFEERKDLDVAHGATDLGDHDVDIVAREAPDTPLDLVGDVRDHLNGASEVVAPSFGREHRLVDRPGGGVRVAREVLVDEPLVMPEVEIGLAAVVGNEHLTVLERIHRARIDVDVRIELLHRDSQTPALQQTPE